MQLWTYVEEHIHTAVLLLDRREHLLDILLFTDIAHADLTDCPLSTLFGGRLEFSLSPSGQHEHELFRMCLRREGVGDADGRAAADTARCAGDHYDSVGCHPSFCVRYEEAQRI